MKHKILVIEDEIPLLHDLQDMLTIEGFDVQIAANGRLGLDLALSYKPDLIICDVMMPQMNGLEMFAELQKHRHMALTPFIFLTALADRMDQRNAMQMGADDYITKPFRIEELLTTIQTRLTKRDSLRQEMDANMQKLRQNLITALPHELRTPLNTIIGFSDMMRTDADEVPPKQIELWAGMIHDAGMRLYRLIDNYLIYARLEVLGLEKMRGHINRSAVSLNVHHVIHQTANKKAKELERQADVQFELVDIDQLAVPEEDLIKIIDELADNAFKLSKEGQTVTFKLLRQADAVIIEVWDQGRGIRPEQIEQIGAYMQFDRWLHEQQGMGLGLPIVQRLIQLNDGQLSLHPQSVGTCARVRFPLIKP
jgi:two-component system, sensor histidine kinase and response regulator